MWRTRTPVLRPTAARCSAASSRMSRTATWRPPRRNRAATANPIPRAPPVTTAPLPFMEPPLPDPSLSNASRGNSLTLTFSDGYTTVVPMRRTRSLLAILFAAAFLIVSCSEKLAKQPGITDSVLFSRGQQQLGKKKDGSAIEHFQVLLERFPTSPLAPRAQLALADARMENKDNVEAEGAYDDFLRLYPANDHVPSAPPRRGELLS